jgi:hypothetical protein
MKIQIIVNENLVMIDNVDLNIDCSAFADSFVFCEINDDEKWIEKKPFNGREDLDNWDEVLGFIDTAKEIIANKNVVEVDINTTPTQITMRQTRLYLLSIDLLDTVETIVSQNKAWQIEWEYASEVQRTNQLIVAMQQELELTDAQVNEMFLEASKL